MERLDQFREQMDGGSEMILERSMIEVSMSRLEEITLITSTYSEVDFMLALATTINLFIYHFP
ncbi:MAG: hypothetical protein ABDH32_02855 [Candidatus Caldarchaeales archaeon]